MWDTLSILFVQVIMKCIVNKYTKQQYHLLTRKDIIQMKLKVYVGPK